MATTSISQMTTAATVDNGDLFEIAHPDAGSATGYASNKQSMAAIADHMATSVNYPTMNTTAKTIVGAINELEAGGGGGGSSTLAGLTDVDITTPTDGQVLRYNATAGKWENGSGGGSDEEIFLCSLPIITTRTDTTGTTKKGFYAMENAQPPYQPPQGYKKKYRVSALLNTDDSNTANIYINNELLLSATTWIGGQTSTFLGHFGAYMISSLIDLDYIAKESRYMGGGSPNYYNFYLASSNSNRAYCENVTLHVYLCKES